MGQISRTDSGTKANSVIFISHRSSDKQIADMLVDFFAGTEIPRSAVFCSSLPGNDINEKISNEVKTALQNSAVNIAILSHDYYQSAYCLNEAGVLWYEESPVILIALPEINSSNMYGFLDNEYKLRRLDYDVDVSYIYDTVKEAVSAPHTKTSIITYESNKLRNRYKECLKTRDIAQKPSESPIAPSLSEITTDDERIVLYYILQNNIRKVSKSDISNWLNKCEIHDVNLDNAFDLLASFDDGAINDNVLEFGLKTFREYSANVTTMLPELKECVNQHTKLAVNTFKYIWDSKIIDPTTGLFIAYIADEKVLSFGSRWMEERQIESIKQWEEKNALDSALSSNYGNCLGFFINNNLVYESDWTSYGNAREYSLYPSLQNLLFNCPPEITQELKKLKDAHCCDLPF